MKSLVQFWRDFRDQSATYCDDAACPDRLAHSWDITGKVTGALSFLVCASGFFNSLTSVFVALWGFRVRWTVLIGVISVLLFIAATVIQKKHDSTGSVITESRTKHYSFSRTNRFVAKLALLSLFLMLAISTVDLRYWVRHRGFMRGEIRRTDLGDPEGLIVMLYNLDKQPISTAPGQSDWTGKFTVDIDPNADGAPAYLSIVSNKENCIVERRLPLGSLRNIHELAFDTSSAKTVEVPAIYISLSCREHYLSFSEH